MSKNVLKTVMLILIVISVIGAFYVVPAQADGGDGGNTTYPEQSGNGYVPPPGICPDGKPGC